MQRIARNSAANIEVFFSVDEVITDPDGNVATIGITKADGSVLVAAGTATNRVGVGHYRYALAGQSALQALTATWSGTFGGAAGSVQTVVEIVGGFYFALEELRASDTSLADPVKYTTQQLADARAYVEDEFERITEVAFVPRFARVRLTGSGGTSLLLPNRRPRTMLSARAYTSSTSFTALDAGELADVVFDTTGEASRLSGGFWFGAPRLNYVVEYEHGYDSCPADVKQKAMRRARMVLNEFRSAIPDRATSFIIEGGTAFKLDMPKLEATGVPDIDAVLARYSMRVGGIA